MLKINNKYIQSWLSNLENFSNVPSFSEKNSYLITFKKEDIFRAEVKRNSLIVFFTNGYHGRTPFIKKDTSKKVVFLHFSNFNILSLFSFLKYNQ